MWSYMMISLQARALRRMEIIQSGQAEPFLENLAHPPRGLPELQRRCASGAMETADEIREVVESDVISDVGHVAIIFGQQACGMTKSQAHEILMRGHAEHGREQPQKMKRTDAGLGRGIIQVDGPVGSRVDPGRAIHRAAAIACRDLRRLALLP